MVNRSLYWLASNGRPVWHTVFTGNPQNRQKVPKIAPRGAIRGPPPPNLYLYNFFRRATTSPKVAFFYPRCQFRILKKKSLWALGRHQEKIIEVQDKKREKMGILGDFRGFLAVLALWGTVGVKAVYYSGHYWNARY